MTIDTTENFHRFFRRHSLKQTSHSLKIAIAASDVFHIVQLSVHDIEIYLF